jgi:beta-lactamase superfamily II metal-dependent hydrolase
VSVADKLVVRLYNVRFGDAILVIVPDKDPQTGSVTKRRILIDVGNAPLVASPEGGDDAAFKPVIDHLLAELNGQPIDLYVMTHEHLDHVQGLFYAAAKLFQPGKFLEKFKADNVWLTGSAAPDYYDHHPEAKKKKLAMLDMYTRIAAYLAAAPAEVGLPFAKYLKNNDPSKTTQCVEFLRKLNPATTTYVHRGKALAGTHPFKEAKFEIWAPEEDTSDYYGHFQPFGADAGGPAPAALPQPGVTAPQPPPGVDLGAFLNLVDARRNPIGDNILAIDQAENNTSVVFSLEWRGWRLLFPGDAEVRSWKTMRKNGVLKPVHFLKVAHHGSHNGTPTDAEFEAILPATPPDNRPRVAAISTWTETYAGIPHPPTNTRLQSRCALMSTLDDTTKLFYEVEFPG